MKKAAQALPSGNVMDVVETAIKFAQAQSQHRSMPQQADTRRLWVLCDNIHPYFYKQIEPISWIFSEINIFSFSISPVLLTKYFTGILLWA